MAHGNIYAAEKTDAALSNYFRVGNLTALRELALLWLADQVDEQLDRYRAEHGITATWEARERVVVALTGGPEGETLIRPAARIAARAHGGYLLAVHVTSSDGLAGTDPQALARQRVLVESLGGSYHTVVGDSVPVALLDYARAENATQLVLGASRRGRLATFLTGPGIGAAVTRLSGAVMAVVALPVLTLALVGLRPALTLPSQILLYLLTVVAVAFVGGVYPALAAAVAGSLLLNYFFVPPLHTFTIAEPNNVLALVVFLTVVAAVSSVVDLAARRTRQAARLSREAVILSTAAGSVLRGETALPALLDRVRSTFAMSGVTLLERRAEHPEDHWEVVASAGVGCHHPDDADVVVAAGEGLALVLRGRLLRAEDERVLTVFAVQAAAALERQRLAEAAAEAKPLAEADRFRTALLAAASHDLRTPLASAKAAVSSLRSTEVRWTTEERDELLATAEESLDKLARLAANLLDMSRLRAGALSVFPRAVGLDEIVPLALDELGADGEDISVDVPATLPEVLADPGLLERVIANLVANAVRFSPPGRPPRVAASALGSRVELRVADRGPGIPAENRDRVFAPFQRLGDRDNSTGVGLGLALSRGLVEAMNGALHPEDTPGGGLTMVVSLPAAPQPTQPEPELPEVPADVEGAGPSHSETAPAEGLRR